MNNDSLLHREIRASPEVANPGGLTLSAAALNVGYPLTTEAVAIVFAPLNTLLIEEYAEYEVSRTPDAQQRSQAVAEPQC